MKLRKLDIIEWAILIILVSCIFNSCHAYQYNKPIKVDKNCSTVAPTIIEVPNYGYAEVGHFGITDNFVWRLTSEQIKSAMVNGYPCLRCHR
jgi:hypothetical protein